MRATSHPRAVATLQIEEVTRGDEEVEVSEGAKAEETEEREEEEVARERLAALALKKAEQDEELQLKSNLEAID